MGLLRQRVPRRGHAARVERSHRAAPTTCWRRSFPKSSRCSKARNRAPEYAAALPRAEPTNANAGRRSIRRCGSGPPPTRAPSAAGRSPRSVVCAAHAAGPHRTLGLGSPSSRGFRRRDGRDGGESRVVSSVDERNRTELEPGDVLVVRRDLARVQHGAPARRRTRDRARRCDQSHWAVRDRRRTRVPRGGRRARPRPGRSATASARTRRSRSGSRDPARPTPLRPRQLIWQLQPDPAAGAGRNVTDAHLTDRSSTGENAPDERHTKARAPFAPWDRRELPGSSRSRRPPPGRQLQVGRDAPLRGARRLGRHRARARREAGARPAHLSPRLARRAVAQAAARAARDEPGAADPAAERRVRHVHGRGARARGARADDREARRRLPRADPAVHRRVHVPPQRHEPDHRRADDPLAQVRPAGRVRGLARRRDAAPVADRHAREGGTGRRAASRSWRQLVPGVGRHRRPR